MKVFLDTTILLDVLLEREGFEDSVRLFELQEDGKVKLFVSILTMVNVAIVYKKTVGQYLASANLKYLSTLVDVLPMDEDQLQSALLLDGPDFEDTLQATCAATAACDYLVTRNQKDFIIKKGLAKKLSLPVVMSPSGFLSNTGLGVGH